MQVYMDIPYRVRYFFLRDPFPLSLSSTSQIIEPILNVFVPREEPTKPNIIKNQACPPSQQVLSHGSAGRRLFFLAQGSNTLEEACRCGHGEPWQKLSTKTVRQKSEEAM